MNCLSRNPSMHMIHLTRANTPIKNLAGKQQPIHCSIRDAPRANQALLRYFCLAMVAMGTHTHLVCQRVGGHAVEAPQKQSREVGPEHVLVLGRAPVRYPRCMGISANERSAPPCLATIVGHHSDWHQ
jgi:hypothetical protein